MTGPRAADGRGGVRVTLALVGGRGDGPDPAGGPAARGARRGRRARRGPAGGSRPGAARALRRPGGRRRGGGAGRPDGAARGEAAGPAGPAGLPGPAPGRRRARRVPRRRRHDGGHRGPAARGDVRRAGHAEHALPRGRGDGGPRAGSSCADAQLAEAEDLLRSCGRTVVLAEKHLDAVTALSGSGPAYVFYVVEAMVEAGVLLGLPRATATELVVQTVVGAGRCCARPGSTRPSCASR